MFDLISIGDCTIDHFFKIHDAHLGFNLDKTKRELCINYGDKIPAEGYGQLVAGNNANNAIGAVRLGLKTSAYLNVGGDVAGRHILEELKKAGVDTTYIAVHKEMSSNASAVISYRGERTILIYHQPWAYQLPDLERTKWIYFSSLSSSFPETGIVRQLENYLERTGARMVFNPGTFQLKHGIKRYPNLLSLTTLLVVNRDEGKDILGWEREKGVEGKKILKALADLGPKMVVVTEGKEGSWGYDGERCYKLGVFPAKVADMTGAGDAYATGVLAGLFYGKDLPEAMRWGAANGASVVEQIGPQAGLLTYEEIKSRLKESLKVQPVVICL